jgi:hypothetical protein
VCKRRHAVERTRQGEREHGTEGRREQRESTQERDHRERADEPDRRSDPHLDHELSEDDEPRSVVVGGELDHPDHEGDARWVVHARLALERHTRASRDLALAEHREHHRRIGRRKRGANDSRRHPFEPEHVVGEHRNGAGGRERPEDPEREDRREGAPEAPPADVHAAVEENHDQGDHGDPLHGEDRDFFIEAREEV